MRILSLPVATSVSMVGSVVRAITTVVNKLKSLTGNTNEIAQIEAFEKDNSMSLFSNEFWSKYTDFSDLKDDDGSGLSGIQKVIRVGSRILYAPVIVFKKIFNTIAEKFQPIADFVTKIVNGVKKFLGIGDDGERNDNEGLSAWDKIKENPVVKTIGTLMSGLFGFVGGVVNGAVGFVSGVMDLAGKAGKAIGDFTDWLSDGLGSLGDAINGFFGGGSGSGLFTTTDGFNRLNKTIALRQDSTEEYRRKVLEHLGTIASGSGLVGSGTQNNSSFSVNEDGGKFLSQRSTKYANIRFNSKLDSERQTIQSDGCAPAVAAMAINGTAGRIGMKEAANYAVENGYKARNAGTSANYFKDIWAQHGMNTSYTSNAEDIMNSLRSGNQVALLGRDARNKSKVRSPFGPNNHYVLATGVDDRGNIIVNDPEARRCGIKYSSKILRNVSLGAAAQAGSGSSPIRSVISKYIGGSSLAQKSVALTAKYEGKYDSVAANDNGACSIGKIQWHGTRALNLLKSICNENPSQAKNILGSSLYNEVMSSSDWSYRKFNTSEANAVSKLLATSESQKIQNQLSLNDAETYIDAGKKMGLKNEDALLYYSDLVNQYGAEGAKKFANRAASIAGNMANVTADHLNQAALALGSKYASRRNGVLADIKAGNFDTSSTDGLSVSSSSSSDSGSTSRFGVLGQMDQLFTDMANTYIGKLLGMSESGTSSSGDSSYGDSSSSYSADAGANAVTPTQEALGEAIAAEARKYIGGKYVWGGKTLGQGVDCSGFVWRILEKFGYSSGYMTSKTGAASTHYGPKVNFDDIRAGDILFFGRTIATVHHVGIASSSNMMIHAKGEKYGIVEDDFRKRGDLVCARRYSKTTAGKAYIAAHGSASGLIGSGSDGSLRIKRRLNS